MVAGVPVAFFSGPPGGGEILIVLLAMLLLFGSKNLPRMARTLGRTLEEFRRATREVTNEIMRADHELEELTDEPQKRPEDGDPKSPPPGVAAREEPGPAPPDAESPEDQ